MAIGELDGLIQMFTMYILGIRKKGEELLYDYICGV